MIKKYLLFSTLIMSFNPNFSSATVFDITPQGSLPTTVPKYGKTSAFYTITNTTTAPLTQNTVQSLPSGISQVDCDPNYCKNPFNLGPKGSATESCILKLTISKPIDSYPITICTDNSQCDTSTNPLTVVEGDPIPFSGVAVGPYSNHSSRYFPLLAASTDSGTTWTYPPSIFQNLTNTIDANFYAGLLSGVGCSGSGDKTICAASGSYCTSDNCSEVLPLVAVGKGPLTQWKYPKEIFQNLKNQIDSNFVGGILNSSHCVGSGGNGLCIAAGVYYTNQTSMPLLALTSNGGKTWGYPTSIFQNLTTAIDPEFASGTLTGAGCSPSSCNRVCIASGFYCKDTNCNNQIPLIALSTDQGSSWSYPAEVHQNLQQKIDPNFLNGHLENASCSGNKSQAICIASGSYTNDSTTYPLLAQSKNNGASWTYPTSIFKNLETIIGHGFKGGFFNANSCTGSENKAVCIAAGVYFTKGRQFPIIALTRDGGDTWTYPPYIYTKLRSAVDPNLISAVFDGASCIGTGKTAVCMAAGSYCSGTSSPCDIMRPLLAVSTDAGKHWNYPSEIFSNLNTKIDSNFKDGLFSAVSCYGSAAHSFCFAAGQYTTTNFTIVPLLAYSTDNGQTWTYPSAIFKNLTSIIDSDFAAGSFFSGSATGGAFKALKKMGLIK
jgi:hypothetical protein